MPGFQEYQHVCRWGHSDVIDIQIGNCFVFPKLDGSNASVWLENDEIQAGSRRRHLSQVSDNHGFCEWAGRNDNLLRFLRKFPEYRLHGEWLVPHTLMDYRASAWRQFYVFDVMRDEKYLPYFEYRPILEDFLIDYIPCVAQIYNGTAEQFQTLMEINDFLMKPGCVGEGIVIKNYEFVNKFGRTTWAKMVRSEFKERNHKAFGPPIIQGREMVENKIAEHAVTQGLVDKERAKIDTSPVQPRLLYTVYHCVLFEEIPDLVKKLKNPTIDFKLLQRFVFNRVKELAPDLF